MLSQQSHRKNLLTFQLFRVSLAAINNALRQGTRIIKKPDPHHEWQNKQEFRAKATGQLRHPPAKK
ncbi:MAG: hypothetical protein ACJA2X_001767 [Halocynthiibacter sp.]|jgi:hypothetical protein